MDSQIETHELVWIIVGIFSFLLFFSSSWLMSKYYYYALIISFTVFFGFFLTTVDFDLNSKYEHVLTIITIYTFFMYIFASKFLLQHKAFDPIDYKITKREIYQTFGKRASTVLLAEIPIIGIASMITTIIIHLLLE